MIFDIDCFFVPCKRDQILKGAWGEEKGNKLKYLSKYFIYCKSSSFYIILFEKISLLLLSNRILTYATLSLIKIPYCKSYQLSCIL